MTDMIERDPVDQLAGYRPTRAQLDAEFGPARRAAVRTAVMAGTPHRTLRWRPLRTRRAFSATAASAIAVAALIAGVVIAVVARNHETNSPRAASAPHLPAAIVDTPTVGTGQFAYRTTTGYEIDAAGSATAQGRSEIWAAPDGSLWARAEGNANRRDNSCEHRPAPEQADFGQPTSAFFAQLPTDAAALEAYLRAHVSGSSSQDEALFVATGDMLRSTDLLASSQLRFAAVGALSGISGMTVHTGVTDYRGRDAVRVDWVSQALRPGELSSLYFDPATYQLLEERDGPSGGPSTYSGPSPAYTAHESDPSPTSNELPGPATLTVMTEEKVVDAVPPDVQACATAAGH